MTVNKKITLEQIRSLLDSSTACQFEAHGERRERYQWIQSTLLQVRYRQLNKADKGTVIRYLMKLSAYSRQHITRLIKQSLSTGKIVSQQQPKRGFKRYYTDADIQRLAKLDELHETPSGAVIKKLCERAHHQFNEPGYERLAGISVSHLYNLRRSKGYQHSRRHFEKTRSKPSTLGERRKPQPNGNPGYLRVDTVHQGDQDGIKGVYHINVVDEVTQFQVSCCVEKISEHFLVPALTALLALIPFEIRGFHSDNGSEYINKTVASLLEKLRIEFTKSRSRHCNDNALAESKNAAIIRKHFGYSHIPQHWANVINDTVQQPLYRYVNFHRPCYFPVIEKDSKGKERKKYRYENMMTPYEKLRSLPNCEECLKLGITPESLREFAQALSDNEAAKQLQLAKQHVFKQLAAHEQRRA